MSIQVKYSIWEMTKVGSVSDFGFRVFQILDYLHKLYRFSSTLDFQLYLDRDNRN